MIWLAIVLELILVGLVILAVLKEKKKGCIKRINGFHLLQITGGYVAKWLEPTRSRREKNEIYQIVCKIAGEEEGDVLFSKYRQRRWGLIIGFVFLINGILICRSLWTEQETVVFESEQQRPAHGEGDISEEVTVILKGDEQTQSTISIRIPEKEVEQEEAQQRVEEATEYIKSHFQDIIVKDDISLPVEWNGVTFYYESMTPELMNNHGGWLGEIKETPQSIKLKITAVLAGQKKEEVVELSTAIISELSAEERLLIVTEQVTNGDFLTDNQLILPQETVWGEELRWIEKESPKGLLWVLMSVILFLFALWKQDLKYKQLLKGRDARIRRVYPEFMNELVILVGAGLSLPAAWRRIGEDYQRKRAEEGEIDPLYEEVYRESRELDAGVSMSEVLEEFSSRVRIKEARRFAVLLVQNMRRGDAFLVSRLKELNQEAWDARKRQVREKTEEADTKLLLPLMLMLSVILIIVLSPAMITMQM